MKATFSPQVSIGRSTEVSMLHIYLTTAPVQELTVNIQCVLNAHMHIIWLMMLRLKQAHYCRIHLLWQFLTEMHSS